MRVRGVTARITSRTGKRELRPERDLDDAAAGGVGAGGVHVERRHDDDRFDGASAGLSRNALTASRQDALVEPVGQQQAVRLDTQPSRRRPRRPSRSRDRSRRSGG